MLPDPPPPPAWICTCGHLQAHHYLKTIGRTEHYPDCGDVDYEVETFPCDGIDCDCEDFEVDR